MSERAIDDVSIKSVNGDDLKFLLTMGSIRRLKKRLEVKKIGELLARISDDDDLIVAILYESWQAKPDGSTEDLLADMLPGNIKTMAESVAALFGVSMPEPRPMVPPAAAPETVQ